MGCALALFLIGAGAIIAAKLQIRKSWDPINACRRLSTAESAPSATDRYRGAVAAFRIPNTDKGRLLDEFGKMGYSINFSKKGVTAYHGDSGSRLAIRHLDPSDRDFEIVLYQWHDR